MAEYKRLNPKCQIAMYVSNAISMAVLVGIFFVIKYFITQDGEYTLPEYTDTVALIVFGILAVYMIIGPIIYYRRYRYIIDNDKVDVRQGIFFIRRTLTPIERIHQVDVSRGPVLSLLGLANVAITTAGGVANVTYLEIPEAERVAEELNALVTKILKEGRKDESQ